MVKDVIISINCKYPTPIQLSYLVEICLQEQEITSWSMFSPLFYTMQKYSSLNACSCYFIKAIVSKKRKSKVDAMKA